MIRNKTIKKKQYFITGNSFTAHQTPPVDDVELVLQRSSSTSLLESLLNDSDDVIISNPSYSRRADDLSVYSSDSEQTTAVLSDVDDEIVNETAVCSRVALRGALEFEQQQNQLQIEMRMKNEVCYCIF